MKFQEWYDSLGPSIPHGHVAQMKMAWNAAMEHAADSFASQAGEMQMSVEQRLLITVAQRIRAMKA